MSKLVHISSKKHIYIDISFGGSKTTISGRNYQFVRFDPWCPVIFSDNDWDVESIHHNFLVPLRLEGEWIFKVIFAGIIVSKCFSRFSISRDATAACLQPSFFLGTIPLMPNAYVLGKNESHGAKEHDLRSKQTPQKPTVKADFR